MELFGITERSFEVFMLVFARVSMVIAVVPIFGSTNVPVPIKIGLSLFISLITYTIIDQSVVPQNLPLLGLLILILKEGIVGLMFGFVTGIMFFAIQFAGHFISFQMGFAMVQLIDPQSQERVPIIGQFYFIMTILIFLLINGHHLVLSALGESFNLVPIGSGMINKELTDSLILLGGKVFTLAMKISSPILATLYLTDVMMGIIARTVPKMNIFFVSLPLKISIGMILIIVTLSSFPWLIGTLVVEMGENLNILLRLL